MPRLSNFCQSWNFKEGFSPSWTTEPLDSAAVDLPHTAVELPLDYFDETSYQREFTYQKHLDGSADFTGKEVSLIFDGAMANTRVFLDGAQIGGHKDGYTPFEVRLTPHLKPSGNLITVCVDGTENPEIPPFGGQIDYLTYAGIYREIWLKITDQVSIQNVKIETKDVLDTNKSVWLNCFLSNPNDLPLNGTLKAELFDASSALVATQTAEIAGVETAIEFSELAEIQLWELENPYLYQVRISLQSDNGIDRIQQKFGFRTAEFSADGFRLNGEKLKLIGLNRHQSFPYSGYAQGPTSQERDADILKCELACNIVRTSHYPQSNAFLDRCDEIGLLVLEEIPGWQHIGGETWKEESVQNVRRMIERDWNHPSIILWGVRINESEDDDAFYLRTNAMAHQLDSTRQTGGIRKDTGSSFLEDVYTMNDFVLGEFEMPHENRPRTPLREQSEVTELPQKTPYLVTEYNGHMFPTKVSDQEQRQVEHVTRHLEVLNAAYGDDNIAGCIGWCMFDYNTHKDFGSGDRICHHGVMTIFREPKFAAYAYASQGSPKSRAVLQPVTCWARGERNIGGTLPLMILSNCDFLRLNFPNGTSVDLQPDTKTFSHLPHPPFMLRESDLSGGEVGHWGMEWTDIEMVGYVDNAPIITRTLLADPVATKLDVKADCPTLSQDRNEVRISVKALDQAGNLLPYIDLPITIEVDGPATIIGPNTTALKGGATAFWIRSERESGEVVVRIHSARFATQEVRIDVLNS
ncbi:beta-D-galactosidase [Rhodobacterales bacterium 52_120_T64]|nr:beta-D-galactosidase [Rhodobacterales bacterium 52_120_T64]